MARWFKGNMHTHSLWSDGDDYPEMIVDWYKSRGYHFLALSDHNVLSQGQRWMPAAEADARAKGAAFDRYRARFGDDWVETRDDEGQRQVRLKPLGEFRALFEEPGKFLLVQSEEITDWFERKPIHMNAGNIQERIEPQGGTSVTDVIDNNLAAIGEQAERLGVRILAHVNHPNFHYAITPSELASVTRERFFEIYNGHPEVNQLGDDEHVSIERMWDLMNTMRLVELDAVPLYGLATDDSHRYFGGNSPPGRGWIMVRAAFLTPEHLIGAIEAGDFYASTGVTLADVQHSGDELHVQVDGEDCTIDFIGVRAGADPDQVGTVLKSVKGRAAAYQLTGDELYVRALITADRSPADPSYEGQRAQAWTQPVGWAG